jgi:hypothetical protein
VSPPSPSAAAFFSHLGGRRSPSVSPKDNLRALTGIKGVRDIASGALLLVVWATVGRSAGR